MDLTTVVDFKLLSKYLQRHGKIMSIYESVYMRFHMAITESPNGEPGNRMTGMRAMGVGMQGIGMVMQEIWVEMREMGGGNVGNLGENAGNFHFNLKYLGWQYRAYIKTAKNADFCQELLSKNDFEAVLVTFCCYDHVTKASEEVQRIATDQKENRKCSLCVIIC